MNIYIPIGSNCSTSHYLRKHNMRHIAYPFDWNCASLEMVYNALSNNFKDFLNDIFIGTKINRLYFGDEDDNLIVSNETIFPIICKKYNILFPHDFNKIDTVYINKVKNKYKRRINRINSIINNGNMDKTIYLIYCNIDFSLNKWQKSVYNEYNTKILLHYTCNNTYFLTKIKELFKDKKNINVISLNELKTMKLF
tara:strand:+ start:2869 stop:3456 length:588 start_codon:yes stop_codon:yes gene_type:complete